MSKPKKGLSVTKPVSVWNKSINIKPKSFFMNLRKIFRDVENLVWAKKDFVALLL